MVKNNTFFLTFKSPAWLKLRKTCVGCMTPQWFEKLIVLKLFDVLSYEKF